MAEQILCQKNQILCQQVLKSEKKATMFQQRLQEKEEEIVKRDTCLSNISENGPSLDDVLRKLSFYRRKYFELQNEITNGAKSDTKTDLCHNLNSFIKSRHSVKRGVSCQFARFPENSQTAYDFQETDENPTNSLKTASTADTLLRRLKKASDFSEVKSILSQFEEMKSPGMSELEDIKEENSLSDTMDNNSTPKKPKIPFRRYSSFEPLFGSHYKRLNDQSDFKKLSDNNEIIYTAIMSYFETEFTTSKRFTASTSGRKRDILSFISGEGLLNKF